MASSGWQRSGIDRHERGATHTRRTSADTVTQQHTYVRGPSFAAAEQPVRPDMQLAGQCPAAHPMQPPGGLYFGPQCYWSYPPFLHLQTASGLAADCFPDYHPRSASTAAFVRAALYPPASHEYAVQPLRNPYFLGPGNVPVQMVTIFQPVPTHATEAPRQPALQQLDQHSAAARTARPASGSQASSSAFKAHQQQQHQQLPSQHHHQQHHHQQQQQQQQQQAPASRARSSRRGKPASALRQPDPATDADSSGTANASQPDPSDPDSDSDEETSSEVARRVREREVQASAGPEVCNSWDWLAEPFLRDVVRHLDMGSLCSFRLSCQRWRIIADRSVQKLQLTKAKVHNVVAQFPSVAHIDMSGCQNVRNRNVIILARSQLKLQSFAVGHSSANAYGKPRVTNQALAAIADLTGLQALALGDCGAITNNGMAVLTALTKLTSLAVVRCPRIADKGLSILSSFPLLEALDVTGCVKVTDQTLTAAAAAPKLRTLRTGYTRVSGPGIRRLAAASALTSLSFHAEDVPDSALAAIATLPQLQELSIAQCYSMTGEGVLAAARSYACLRTLNLRGTPLAEDHLSALPPLLPHLSDLQIRGIDVSHRVIKALSKLSNLQRLSLDASNLGMHSSHMACLSCLTSLTSLEVYRVRGRAGMLGPIAALPKLRHLHLADCPFDRDPLCIALEPQASMLPGLPDYPALTHLSLSHFALPLGPMMRLLAALKRLQELRLDACRGADEAIPLLLRSFPQVHIHQPRIPGAVSFSPQPAFA